MKLNNIDYNKLITFCQIIDSGTYRRASEVLGITASALSQTVAHLEYNLGFDLFDRVGRKMVPTVRGLEVYRSFQFHHQNFVASLQKIDSQKNKITGVLKIGAYLEFAKSQLTTYLTEFIQAHPEVQIKMTFDTPTRLLSLLEEGQLDLCFSIFPAKGKKAISSVSIYEEELVLITAKNKFPENISFQKIMAAPMIEYYTNHQPIRRWLHLHYQKQIKKIPVRIFASTAEMVLSLVKAGAGVGVVPLYLLKNTDVQKKLKILRPTSKRLTDYIWLLEKNSTTKSQAHKAFAEKIHEKMRPFI